MPENRNNPLSQGILLVDKQEKKTSFSIISMLRKRTQIKKIGHAGTLDPFATGLMVLLIGKTYTRLSDQLMGGEKEYIATVTLGKVSDTFDPEGNLQEVSDIPPSQEALDKTIASFQGKIEQIPPMFSAKKINGQKLYHLARKGKTIERKPSIITLSTRLESYNYPHLILHITCSKGTYVRAIAHDLGQLLGCGAYLSSLRRMRSGVFHVDHAIPQSEIFNPDLSLETKFIHL